METLQMEEADEYEYQYHETETETFLVDIDLSSLNSVAKCRNPRKAPKKSRGMSHGPTGQISNGAHPDASGDDDSAPEPTGKMKQSQQTGDKAKQAPWSIQILDIDTSNPLVSYNSGIYDCTWIDMVGTNMFFSLPAQSSSAKAAQSDHGPTLTGTSRIKIAGHRAKLSKTESQKRKHPQVEGDASTDLRSLPAFASDNAQTNGDIKKQAKFLERLMGIKKRRGEADLVAVIPVSTTGQQLNTQASEPLRDKIDALNRRVVKGDVDALSELHVIHSRLGSSSYQSVLVPNELPVAGNQMQSPDP